jgi:hypothetical protein
MRRHLAVVAVALVAASPVSAQADTASTWPIGSRVRVSTLATGKVVGKLSEVRGDTLVIRKGSGLIKFRRKVHADSTLSMEISRDRYVSGRRVAGGALAGAVGGVLLTMLLTEAVGDICVLGECSPPDPDYGRAAVIGLVGGAAAGAVSLVDRWEKVPSPVRVGFEPSRRQARVALTLAFPRR